jgi:hypothetical protein
VDLNQDSLIADAAAPNVVAAGVRTWGGRAMIGVGYEIDAGREASLCPDLPRI